MCVLEEEIAGTDLHEPIWPSLILPFSVGTISFIYPLLVDLVIYRLT